MFADADPHSDPVRVDHYRNAPYDMLLTLSGDRSTGLIRHGSALPTSRLRYRSGASRGWIAAKTLHRPGADSRRPGDPKGRLLPGRPF